MLSAIGNEDIGEKTSVTPNQNDDNIDRYSGEQTHKTSPFRNNVAPELTVFLTPENTPSSQATQFQTPEDTPASEATSSHTPSTMLFGGSTSHKAPSAKITRNRNLIRSLRHQVAKEKSLRRRIEALIRLPLLEKCQQDLRIRGLLKTLNEMIDAGETGDVRSIFLTYQVSFKVQYVQYGNNFQPFSF